MNWLMITVLGVRIFWLRYPSWYLISQSYMSKSKSLERSAEILTVITLTSHDLKHGAERFESSTLISLVKLNSTELEMIQS
jgi:hypothetical protein